MPHPQRRGRQQYRRARQRLLQGASQCYWCGLPISTALPVGHPQKATADHLVPLSKGGPDDISNLVACCARCNSRRGNRNPASILPPPQRSREW